MRMKAANKESIRSDIFLIEKVVTKRSNSLYTLMISFSFGEDPTLDRSRSPESATGQVSDMK